MAALTAKLLDLKQELSRKNILLRERDEGNLFLRNKLREKCVPLSPPVSSTEPATQSTVSGNNNNSC